MMRTLIMMLMAATLAGGGCPTSGGNKPTPDAAPWSVDLVPAGNPLPTVYLAADSITLQRRPYLQQVTETSVIVMWEAAEACRAVVEIQTPTLYGHTLPGEPALRHEILIRELPKNAPDVSYRVRCIVGDVDTIRGAPEAANVQPWHSFRLAPAVDEGYRFLVYGDNRTLFFQHEAVVAQMLEEHPDLVINVGDVVTDGRVYEQWDAEYFRPAAELLAQTPSVIAIGNHEEDADHFYELVSQPGTENYFAFPYGNSYHVVLDSNPDKLYEGSPQLSWFDETVNSDAARQATWLFAHAHHPPYSEGWDSPGYDGDEHMRFLVEPLAVAAGVDIFFNGHTHDYERGERDGVTWIITGGGGSALDSFQQDFEHIIVYDSVLHFCRLDIQGATLQFEALDIFGNEVDRFTLTQ